MLPSVSYIPPDSAVAAAQLRELLLLAEQGPDPINQRYTEPERYQSRWDRFIAPPSDWWVREWANLAARFRAWL